MYVHFNQKKTSKGFIISINSSVDIQIFYIVTKLLHVDGIHLFAHLLTLDNVYAMTHQMVI